MMMLSIALLFTFGAFLALWLCAKSILSAERCVSEGRAHGALLLAVFALVLVLLSAASATLAIVSASHAWSPVQ